MYNPEFKQRFLEESNIQDSTRKLYKFILEKASITEFKVGENGKDIYEFNPYECDQLIFSYSRQSKQMVSVIVATLKRYMDFYIANNTAEKDFFNYFSTISGVADYKKYVDVTAIENKYVTFEGLEEVQKILVNEQDVALIELVYCGVMGKEGSELINLRVKDVLPNKIVLPTREIDITDRTYNIIQDAIEQKEYIRGNGELADNAKGETMVINPTDFVLRSAGSTKFGQITYSSLQMRMNRIKDFFGNPYLNLTNIWHAGMLFHLMKIKIEKGSVDNEDYKRINEMFGYSPTLYYQSKVRFDPFL
jgi:site-specific recombinase XerD